MSQKETSPVTVSATASKQRMTTGVDADYEASAQNKAGWKSKGPNFATPADIVTFYIGKEGEEEQFLVHKEFARAYSPVLKAAFNSSFIEGQTQTYRLTDVRADAFRMLVKWFYTQTIEKFDFADVDDAHSENRGALAEEQDLNLVHLWIVAVKLLIPKLQNTAVAEIQNCKWGNGFATTKWFSYAYEHTSADSPLRHLAADSCLYEYNFGSDAGADVLDQRPDDFPRLLLLDIFKEVTQAMRTGINLFEAGNQHPRPEYTCERN